MLQMQETRELWMNKLLPSWRTKFWMDSSLRSQILLRYPKEAKTRYLFKICPLKSMR